ncbi:MAG: hypothetical protein C0606_16255 [Hyphomicrobiales bacterium]|nr:MAG: hypothetical protein C0606_16255 [Hyphomicrobiales bacterium]
MFRPAPCQWFEMITTRKELVPTLRLLASTGAIELQTREGEAGPLVVPGTADKLARFHELARTYHAYWPQPDHTRPMRLSDPAAVLARGLEKIDDWIHEADPLIYAREGLAREERSLREVAAFLDVADDRRLPPLSDLSRIGARMEGRVFLFPKGEKARTDIALLVPASLMRIALNGTEQDFVLLFGRKADLDRAAHDLAALKVHPIHLPVWLPNDLAAARKRVADRLAVLTRNEDEASRGLEDCTVRHDLAGVLADFAAVEWLVEHGSELTASDRLAWITGWTTATSPETFCQSVEGGGVSCLVQFSDPPEGVEAPAVLRNPPWIRAFETFAYMLGTPSGGEADPSPVVAVIAPILFGFMFGDVGQGFVLLVIGLLLRRQLPFLAMLVPGGVMAMVFGVLFGAVFSREDVFHALWLSPLHEPITVLAAALALGAVILFAGLVLNALQAFWRHAFGVWLARDAGVMAAYLATLGAVFEPAFLWGIPLGLAWFSIGAALTASSGRIAAGATALAEFVEQFLQLLVNTVSFARVGAFALAHAGLSLAVTGIADAAGGIGGWIVMLAGNLLILGLEGLVVGIQTTRLVLFEFFVRFLKGGGRPFRPLPPPKLPTLGINGGSS